MHAEYAEGYGGYEGDGEMAWREYVDPRDMKTYITDDAGNFLVGGLADYGLAPAAAAAPAPRASQPYASGYDWPGLGRSLGSLNQQDFDEMRRQFDSEMDLEGRRLGLTQQQIDAQKEQFWARLGEEQRQFNTNTYTNLATALLEGATRLRGPENWLDYAEYTSGGRDIFKALYGDQAVPAFGAPTGYSKPSSITSILQALGVPPAFAGAGSSAFAGAGSAGGPPAPAPPGPATFQTANGAMTIEQMREGLKAANSPIWQSASPGTIAYEYGRVTGKPVTPADQATADQLMTIWNNRPDIRSAYTGDLGALAPLSQMVHWWQDAQQEVGSGGLGDYIRRMGWGGAPGAVTGGPYQYGENYGTPAFAGAGSHQGGSAVESGPGAPGRSGTGFGSSGPYQYGENYGTPAYAGAGSPGQPAPTAQQPMAALPHQVNPAVWDSLSNTAKKMILASAEKGYTPSGAWTAEDYLRQIDAARPIETSAILSPNFKKSQTPTRERRARDTHVSAIL